ncbi:ABC transporter permease [Pedobacter insulae]|uniref:Putative ABC transport system permease protein n=1 Tax=Pedobacter insulae TaxID=414048 RepID=A0A1I2WJR9_9SPHI|nr:ABC transporter permease [Pedobacter insulae]SFH01553.1 putative ABC transport system permease protein [Pedobacter insulae]
MFKLNFKIALRNLWKNKGYTLLNIFGLAVGLAGFIMILLFANHERSYDTWNPEAAETYRISIRWAPGEEEYSSSPAELAPALKATLPEIEDYGRFYVWDMFQRLVSTGKNELYFDHIMGVDSTWFNLFPYQFIYGDVGKSLLSKDQIVLSSKASEKLFGKGNPVGKNLVVNTTTTYIVSGVYKEPNTPEHMDADAFVKKSSSGDGWGNGNFYTYLKIKKGINKAKFEKKLNQAFLKLPILKEQAWLKTAQIYLTPVTEIYLHATSSQDPAKRGNPTIVTILVLFSALLLVIACINFTNLSIAQSVKRAKETGVRKVLGAGQRNLISYFLTETIIQCICALLIAFVLAEAFMPVLNNLMDTNLTLFNYAHPVKLIVQISVVMLVVTVLAGGYAAFFLANYEPVKVLKGNFSRSVGSLWMRKTLISVQFVVAIVFMIALIIIRQQVNFIKNQDVGFKKSHVMVFKIRKGESRKNFAQLKQRLLNLEGVKEVSRVNYYPGVKAMQVIGREFEGKSVQNLSMVTVDFDYFEVMGMPAQLGRTFSKQYITDSTAIVVNESAVKKYGLQKLLGQKWIDNRTIIGVVKDHIQKGMETAAEPTGFVVEGRNTNRADNVIIKVADKNLTQIVKGVQNTWEAIEPFPFQYSWLDQSFANVYVQYVRLDKLFNIFTYVTLAIAMLGLFALASFTVQERTKEIGVRKVLGAETSDILKMLNKSFLLLIVVANLIAIPLAYILSNNWLSGFAYRTIITIWPFVVAMAISVIVTLITVSLQALKTAKAKPVDALKYE